MRTSADCSLLLSPPSFVNFAHHNLLITGVHAFSGVLVFSVVFPSSPASLPLSDESPEPPKLTHHLHQIFIFFVIIVSNSKIGICKSVWIIAVFSGIVVILTARDEKRGLDAAQKIKDCSDIPPAHVFFHQLDVVDPGSISALAGFVRTQFGKLDILVNNAGIGGVQFDDDSFKSAFELAGGFPTGEQFREFATQTYESIEECLKINYYGARHTTEALLPLLLLSDSSRIVNVSSFLGLLKNIPNEWVKEMLNDEKKLSEERIDEVLNELLKDFKEGLLESKGWPTEISAYILAKAALNAYTRLLAKKYSPHQDLCINCVCPGYCKTDITANTGLITATEGAQNAVRLALLPTGGPTGCFFSQKEMMSSY